MMQYIGGATGEAGPPGPPGEDGLDGLSAFEVAQVEGFEGTEEEWLLTLVGPAGEPGPIGETGPEGPIVPIGQLTDVRTDYWTYSGPQATISGAGAPAPEIGDERTIYIDTDFSPPELYQKIDGVWEGPYPYASEPEDTGYAVGFGPPAISYSSSPTTLYVDITSPPYIFYGPHENIVAAEGDMIVKAGDFWVPQAQPSYNLDALTDVTISGLAAAGYVLAWDGTEWTDQDPTTLGADGLSAYEVAVANGFVGTESEWLEYLKANPLDYAPRAFYGVEEPAGPTPGTFAGTTHSVATYAELTSALAAAVDGDIINVTAAVVATATVTINNRLKVTGVGSIESAGGTTDPVTLVNVTAAGVWFDGITIKHKKTSNTSVDTAVAVNAEGFVSSANVEFMEFGYLVRGSFTITGTTTYTGALGNNHRHIVIYRQNAVSEISNVVFDFPQETTARSNFIFVSTAIAGDGVYAPLVVKRCRQLDPIKYHRQFFFHEVQAGTGAALFFEGCVFNDLNGGIGIFNTSGSALPYYQYIAAVNCTQGTAGAASYKGLVYIDGSGAVRPTGTTTLYINNNSTPSTLRVDYTTLVENVAFKNTVFTATTSSVVSFSDALEDAFIYLSSLSGTPGPAGPAGADGADGEPGADGADGADGLSAYEVAVANGFVGTESEWLDSLVGAEGPTGSIDTLTDVVITDPAKFQTLEFDGTNWVNAYAPTVTLARNAEATTLTTGTVVYLFGGTGDHATVKRADNSGDATSSKTMGVVAAPIDASENGPIVIRGYVEGIDLDTGYAEGDVLWLGTGGAFTTTKPVAPAHLVFVGMVVRATNNGIIYVATQNGYELEELHNVIIDYDTINDGDVLTWDAVLGLWGPVAASGGGEATVLHEFDSPYDYMGVAPAGSSTNSAVWTITRIDISGPVVTAVAVGVTWDDRATETYS